MKLVSLIFSLIVISNVSFSQDSNIQIDSITIEKTDDLGNTFSFTFSYEDFDTASHDVSKIREGLIDGFEYFGTDGSVPHTQIKDFVLTINGQNIQIANNIYSNFYNPNIGYEDGTHYIDAFWDNESQSVFVFMNGSDGAGAYSVVWYLNRNGKNSYFVNNDDIFFQFNQ